MENVGKQHDLQKYTRVQTSEFDENNLNELPSMFDYMVSICKRFIILVLIFLLFLYFGVTCIAYLNIFPKSASLNQTNQRLSNIEEKLQTNLDSFEDFRDTVNDFNGRVQSRFKDKIAKEQDSQNLIAGVIHRMDDIQKRIENNEKIDVDKVSILNNASSSVQKEIDIRFKRLELQLNSLLMKVHEKLALETSNLEIANH